MKPARFRYFDPRTLEEAAELAAELGDEAVILAGGQSLVPMMNLRMVQPENVVDLNWITELDYLRVENGHVGVGAMTRQQAAERAAEIALEAPLVAEALPHVAYPAIRRRGTVGGSVAHADPAAELTCALLASDAKVVLTCRNGARRLGLDEFLVGPYMTAREPEEILSAIEIPRPGQASAGAFREFARKRGDFALLLVAVTLTVEQGRCTRARVVVGGAGPVPRRLVPVEEALEGEELTDELFESAAEAARDAVEPAGDAHGSTEYRKRITAVEVRRAIATAAQRAFDGPRVANV